ncbi:sialidase family protein [Polaromonas sp. YR568]|uniref:sialidase family protein n=1 Tax=Polaromonas sp. YR568 TaxID=1855301 RepID=UPI0031379FB6
MNFAAARLRNHGGLALVLAAFALAGWKVLPLGTLAPASAPTPALFASTVAPPAPAAGSSGGSSPIAGPAAALAPGRLIQDSGIPVETRFIPSTPGMAVHAASLVELANGDLRAVWFAGSREGAGDVAIRSAVMNGTSLQWGPETTLLNRTQIERGLWRYVKKIGNPVIARAPDGSLMLWMVTVSLGGWAGSSITWARSSDEGASWSAPRRLVTSPFINISTLVKGAPVTYADGQIGLPVYHEFITKFSEVLRLDADGEVIDKLRVPASRRTLQPVVLVSGPSTAQMFMRSDRAESVMTSSTTDAGQTWSPATAMVWPNPDSALAGAVTFTGGRWLALNPAPRGRESLALLGTAAGGSFDTATPWLVEFAASMMGTDRSLQAHERALTTELLAKGVSAADAQADIASAKRQLCGTATCAPEFSYPYLLQGRDGYLHLVYTWHRARIKHVRLDVARAPGAATPSLAGAKP